MRANMSARGSFTGMPSPLPAGLDHARDLPGRRELAQLDARKPELAIVAPRPARQPTAVAHAPLRPVAWHLRQLQHGREALLGGTRRIAQDRAQLRALGALALGQFPPQIVLL